MKQCIDMEVLGAFAENRLSPIDRTKVLCHLNSCEKCRELMQELQSFLSSDDAGSETNTPVITRTNTLIEGNIIYLNIGVCSQDQSNQESHSLLVAEKQCQLSHQKSLADCLNLEVTKQGFVVRMLNVNITHIELNGANVKPKIGQHNQLLVPYKIKDISKIRLQSSCYKNGSLSLTFLQYPPQKTHLIKGKKS